MIRLLEGDKEILDKIEKITHSRYIYDKENIFKDELMNALTDLLSHYEYLEETFRKFEQEVQDNYKAIAKEEQIYG